MTKLWHYELLCVAEILGYELAGPIANQVLIARWFRARRGRAMGYTYLGLGLGGMISPLLVNSLIRSVGWRQAFEGVGLVILIVLFLVGILTTRSTPEEMGLLPDGFNAGDSAERSSLHATADKRDSGVCHSNSKFLADHCRVHLGHWRDRSCNSTFHFVPRGPRLLGKDCLSILFGLAGFQPMRARASWLRGRSLVKEEHHGGILFFRWCVHSSAWPRPSTKRAVVVRADFWFLNGGGLHADSVGYGGVFRQRLTG